MDRAELESYYPRAREFCGVVKVAAHMGGSGYKSGRDSPFEAQSLGPGSSVSGTAGVFAGDDVTWLLGATAVRIATSADGYSVDHVVVGTATGTQRLEAGRFVLAAGVIETARLLLASTSAAWPRV